MRRWFETRAETLAGLGQLGAGPGVPGVPPIVLQALG